MGIIPTQESRLWILHGDIKLRTQLQFSWFWLDHSLNAVYSACEGPLMFKWTRFYNKNTGISSSAAIKIDIFSIKLPVVTERLLVSNSGHSYSHIITIFHTWGKLWLFCYLEICMQCVVWYCYHKAIGWAEKGYLIFRATESA